MSIWSPETVVSNTPLPVDGSAVVQPVSGPLTDTELRATPVPVSGPLTDTELRATPVPISGSVTTTPLTASSSTITQVSVPATTSTVVLAANGSRKKAILNISKAAVYVKLGSTASATSFTYKTPSADTVIEVTIWTGTIDVFGPACTVTVTELV